MKKRLNLAVGVPAYGGKLVSEHARMFLELGNSLACSSERFELVMFATADINGVDRARNFLLAGAMIKSADWLLMIDADTWVESNDVSVDAGFLLLRMISDADRAEATIVSAPVILRAVAKPDNSSLPMAIYSETEAGHIAVTQAVSGQAYAVGAACMAINLHKIAEAKFQFTDDLSEDLDFCRQIRGLGGKIIVDARVRTGHLSRPFPLYSE